MLFWFDAIWITPVVKQTPWLDKWNGTGYHGYWAQDSHAIEPHLGTEADLSQLSRDAPPTSFGGYAVGDAVYYTGASHTFPNGDKLTPIASIAPSAPSAPDSPLMAPLPLSKNTTTKCN